MFHWLCFLFAAAEFMRSKHPPSPLYKGELLSVFRFFIPLRSIQNDKSLLTPPLHKGEGCAMRLAILSLNSNRKVSQVNFLFLVSAIAEAYGLDRSLVAIGTDAVLVLLEVHLLPVLAVG